MKGSIDRVTAVISGDIPDRAPMFDLLRNDAVINHFTGQTLTVENAENVVPAAYEPTIDATRSMRLPDKEETLVLEDGREQRKYRWTTELNSNWVPLENFLAMRDAVLETPY